MEQSEVASVLRDADVFALACRTTKSGDVDGVPTVILEAMACALPVVSTEVSGVPEAVEQGVTGLLTSPDDEESLAASLAYLAEHPDVGHTLGQRGRDHVLADFNLWRSGQRLTELWAEHAAATSPGSELGGRRSPNVEDGAVTGAGFPSPDLCVSFVMVAKRWDGWAEKAIESVLAQTIPTSCTVEVVVALQEIPEQGLPGEVRVVANPTGRIPAGLCHAIEAAHGGVIARVDSRCVLAPGILGDSGCLAFR